MRCRRTRESNRYLVSAEKNETCNMEYSEHMMNQYRKCMGGYSSTLNIILGTSMLTVVASSAGYRAKLVSTKPLDKAKVKSSKKIDRKKNRRPDANSKYLRI